MKRVLILAALLTAALVSGAQALNQNGAILNGPSVVIQKPVYGEFRDGELAPFVNHTTVRIELRENTARGSVVTVTKRHPVLGKELLKRIESRNGLEVSGGPAVWLGRHGLHAGLAAAGLLRRDIRRRLGGITEVTV